MAEPDALPPEDEPPIGEPSAGELSAAATPGLSLPARLEAILYLRGRPLELGELAAIAGIDRDEAELALVTLQPQFLRPPAGLDALIPPRPPLRAAPCPCLPTPPPETTCSTA